MKTLTKISFLAVASAALAFSSANAQMLTLQTTQQYEGSTTALNNNVALTQTFTNVTAVETMTYRFVARQEPTYETVLEAYFVEWNPTTRVATSVTPMWTPTGTQTIFSSSSPTWTDFVDANGDDYRGFDYTLSPQMSSLNPNATYAVILRAISNTGPNATTRIGLQQISEFSPTDAFTYGVALTLNSVTGYSTLTSTSSNLMSGNSDWGFQQIVITPVPEPQTAAAILVVLFVAGLVGRRVYLKRQEAAAALVPVSAS